MSDWIPESDEVRKERAKHIEVDWRQAKDWWDNLDYETMTKIYLAGILIVASISVIGRFIGKAIAFALKHSKKEEK